MLLEVTGLWCLDYRFNVRTKGTEMRFGLIYLSGGKLKGWKGNEGVGCMKAMIDPWGNTPAK